jgi:hypothetical protein
MIVPARSIWYRPDPMGVKGVHPRLSAPERRERSLGDRHAVERVVPWMGLPKVAAQKAARSMRSYGALRTKTYSR